jgi:hypothetical protein
LSLDAYFNPEHTEEFMRVSLLAAAAFALVCLSAPSATFGLSEWNLHRRKGPGLRTWPFHIGVLDSPSGSKKAGIMAQEPWTAERVREVLSNPAYCLLVPPVITEEMWIKAGVRLINEIGAEAYLRLLLDPFGRSE